MNILTVEGLSYYKRKHIIYQNISINLSKGECYVIMGRDNEGKTSLLRGILGLEKAAEGSVIWGEGYLEIRLDLYRMNCSDLKR